jgi:hypothetical protein
MYAELSDSQCTLNFLNSSTTGGTERGYFGLFSRRVGARKLPLSDSCAAARQAGAHDVRQLCHAALCRAALPGVCHLLRPTVLRPQVPAIAVQCIAHAVLSAVVPPERTERRREYAAARVQDVRVPAAADPSPPVHAPCQHRRAATQGTIIPPAEPAPYSRNGLCVPFVFIICAFLCVATLCRSRSPGSSWASWGCWRWTSCCCSGTGLSVRPRTHIEQMFLSPLQLLMFESVVESCASGGPELNFPHPPLSHSVCLSFSRPSQATWT